MARHRTSRPFPAYTRTEGEAEGAAIVREFPEATGVILFSALRQVMLWLSLPDTLGRPEREPSSAFRAGLRRKAKNIKHSKAARDSVDPLIWEPLRKLAQALRSGQTLERSEIGALCSEIADLAAQNSKPHTEIAFAQALSLADPANPAHALRTARLARNLAQFPRAETWFRRAIKFARADQNHRIYADAYLGLSTLYIRTGNFPAARVVANRALEVARRWELRDLQGAAHQELFHLCADAGKIREAYEHARNAREAYGTSEEYLARLAADLANFWVELGCHARAARIYEALVMRQTWNQNTRTVLVACLARASARAGFTQQYKATRVKALKLIPQILDPFVLTQCSWLIADADLSVGDWDGAEEMASSTLEWAKDSGAAELRIKAETVLELAREHRRLHTGAGRASASTGTETPALERLAERLAAELTEAIASGEGVPGTDGFPVTAPPPLHP